MSELKERLHLAETQLQKEQQLLHSVIEKVIAKKYCTSLLHLHFLCLQMEKSNVNLQGMLAQEVEVRSLKLNKS